MASINWIREKLWLHLVCLVHGPEERAEEEEAVVGWQVILPWPLIDSTLFDQIDQSGGRVRPESRPFHVTSKRHELAAALLRTRGVSLAAAIHFFIALADR